MQGQDALQFSVRTVLAQTEVILKSLPAIVEAHGIDALIIDTVQFYAEVGAIQLGLPYVHVSNGDTRSQRVKKDRSAEILGSRIQRARKKRGWSQEDFAYRANIDRSYMGGVERGERNLSFKKLCAIATTLGRDVASLTRGLPVVDRD
jgi:DNA-binding XRE family transcriptional regulator